MSLPPGFLDELRTRTSLSQVVGRKVIWDTRKSNQAKGDLWAPCPFHQEKTASFHVDDRKGFYYCFGCHEKGDALSFIQQTENVGFMEAVEILAGEAGIPMPAKDPQAQKKADRQTQLREVTEAAQKFFRMALRSGVASDARAYLERRGLSAEAQDRFGLGFAPEGWQALWDHLTAKGVDEKLILEAGLAKPSRNGGKPYDVFRNRIMFPIHDPRGRVIAFGGRAMDPTDNAKYLNSPETPLFDKSWTLYNYGSAREAVGKGQRLIVAEGYMDVIALSEAGFQGAVAPLGTAVTEHQLQMLWRISEEPLVALDGDKAGVRAAYRLVDLALPLLEVGKGLRFALMPEGKDPDDLIRAKGAAAVQKVLDQAMPMVQLLWQRETEGKVFDSPERKAALDKTLRDKIKLIQDQSLRRHYGEEIKSLRWDLFRPATRRGSGRKFVQPSIAPMARTKNSFLAAGGVEAEVTMRQGVILAAVLLTPSLIEEFETELDLMEFHDTDNRLLRDVLLRCLGGSASDVRARVEEEIGIEPLETFLSARHVAIQPCVRSPGDEETARTTVTEELAKLAATRARVDGIAEAEEDFEHLPDEVTTYRLGQAAESYHQALKGTSEDKTEYDVGPNGAAVNREERSAFEALMAQIKFTKGR